MRLGKLLLIWALLVPFTLYSQSSKTEFLDILWNADSSYEKRVHAGKLAIKQFGDSFDYLDRLDTYGKLGELYIGNGNIKAGLDCNKMLVKLSENDTQRAEALHFLGTAYLEAGFADSARSVFRTTLDSIQGNENPFYGQMLLNLAIANFNLGDYDQATNYNIEALRVLKNMEDTVDLLSAVMSLGLIHLATKNYEKALISFRNSFRLSRQIQDARTICKSMNNIGLAHLRLKNSDSALAVLQTVVLKYASDDQVSQNSLFHTFVQMAEAHEELKHLDSALFYFRKAGHIQRVIDKKSALTELWGKMAHFYLQFAPNRDSAQFYAEKALAQAQKIGAKSDMLIAYKILVQLTLQDTANPISQKHFENLITLQEEIYGEQNTRAVQNAYAAFETEKKEQLIAYLDRENDLKDELVANKEQNNVVLLIALVLLLALSVIIVVNQNNKRRAKEALLKESERTFDAEMKALRKQQELSTFQARVQAQEKERNRISRELHDGITPALAAAKLNASTGKIDSEFVASLTKITDDLRNLSHQLAPVALDFQSLEESMAHFLSNFHGINGLLIDLKFPPEGLPQFSPEIQISLYRSVQELMTNISKHSKATEARFEFDTDAEYCTLQVADNGVGFDGETTTHGIGLAGIEQRVEEFGGRLTVSPNQGIGTQVYIEIPLPN